MALTRIDLRGYSGSLADALPRPGDPGSDVRETVTAILARVRAGGDDALRALTAELDGVELDELAVPAGELAAALARIPTALRSALEVAYRRICDYHRHAAPEPGPYHSGGVTVRELRRPVERAGCYAPGGRARYPSTVLMCAAPATVAGVESIVLCVPPAADGRIDDATLAAAAIAGVDEVYRVGGAQAIAAMAYGTASIAPVDVIAGPGNLYVAEAKRQVAGVVGVASAFAGPSEVVVVADADDPGRPRRHRSDRPGRARPGRLGLAGHLVRGQADEVDEEVDRIVEASPRRADLLQTLGTGGHLCLVDDPAGAIAVANAVAPEHLELLVGGGRRRAPARAGRWSGLRRTMGAGQPGGLPGRAEPRAAHQPQRPLRLRACAPTTSSVTSTP